MLKGLDPLLVPAVLGALAEMGHGDVIALVDRNFPAHSCGQRVVELPQASIDQVLVAVLSVLPIDQYSDPAVVHMLTDDGQESPATPGVRAIWERAEAKPVASAGVDRHGQFYDLARTAYLTIRTADTRPYACYLITKGTL